GGDDPVEEAEQRGDADVHQQRVAVAEQGVLQVRAQPPERGVRPTDRRPHRTILAYRAERPRVAGLAVHAHDGSAVVTTGLAEAVVEPQNEGGDVGGRPIREVEGRPARRGRATVACTHATFVTGPRPPDNARGYRPRIRDNRPAL